MTLAEAARVFDHWEDSPPAYQMIAVIARMLGWKPARRPEPPAPAQAPRAVLAIPGMVERPAGEGLPPVVLDFALLKAQAERKRA